MHKKLNDIGLIYVGKGAFDPRYPARDLSAEEVEEFGKEALLATGLYKEPSEKESAQVHNNKKEV